jgi:RNA polymerase sigma-70 factor (ECF subfamily)
MRRRGATEAEIEALYRARFPAFLFSVTALLSDGEAALDTVQEAFALALRRRRSYRGEGTVEAWLWKIVLNTARDRRRSRRREAIATQLEPTVTDAGILDADVRASLRALPERQRLAVFLRHYADLSYDQIAALLGVSPGTVAASLNVAHASLRRRLEEVQR